MHLRHGGNTIQFNYINKSNMPQVRCNITENRCGINAFSNADKKFAQVRRIVCSTLKIKDRSFSHTQEFVQVK